MTLNTSGPISLGGTTAGQSIEIENGGNGTTQISLNDTAVRSLAGVPSGQIAMPTNFYGHSNTVYINLTIAANTQNYNVWTSASANPAYVAGKSVVTVTINPGIAVGSSSTGTYAMSVPSAFNPTDTVTIVNNGYIVGAGGAGAAGSNGIGPANPGAAGAAGGSALYVARATTVTNNGTIGSGGGGGGGGGNDGYWGGGGGGGGAGYNTGAGGGGGNSPYGYPGGGGGAGTLTTGGGAGAGGHAASPVGSGKGGAGGNLGAVGGAGSASGNPVHVPGGAGGGTGNYITGNSFVTWPATGTRLGGVA
jgi:hypothetical protein